MLEIVFGESACGSLKVAQGYGKGKYCGDAVSVLESKRDDVYCFNIALSVGDISDDGMGEQRRKVLRWMLSVGYIKDIEHQVDEKMQNTAKALASVMERYGAGEEVRIWYSDQPDELCGMYWLMAQLHALKCKTTIYLVKLPNWEYGKENTVISRNGWGEIAPSEWGRYISLQEGVRPEFLSACALKWRQLQEENAHLRVMLNGQLQSVSEDIYDSFILREIAAQKEEFNMAIVIGKVLGKYQLGISDAWISNLMEKLIEDGILEVIKDAPEGDLSYRKVLRRCVDGGVNMKNKKNAIIHLVSFGILCVGYRKCYWNDFS